MAYGSWKHRSGRPEKGQDSVGGQAFHSTIALGQGRTDGDLSTQLGMPILVMEIVSSSNIRSPVSNSYEKHPRAPVLLLHSRAPISTSIRQWYRH